MNKKIPTFEFGTQPKAVWTSALANCENVALVIHCMEDSDWPGNYLFIVHYDSEK